MRWKIIITTVLVIFFVGGFYIAHSFFNSQTISSQPLVLTPKTVVEEPTTPPAHKVAATIFVTLTQNGFVPQVITISPNTRVIWINKSGTEATVNSNPHPTHTDYPPLNLGQFPKTNNLSLIFSTSGRYGYHNHFDSTQTGTVIVK